MGLLFEPDVYSHILTHSIIEIWVARPVFPGLCDIVVQLLQSTEGNKRSKLAFLLLGIDVLRDILPNRHDCAFSLHELLPQKPKTLRGNCCEAPKDNDFAPLLGLLHAFLRELHFNFDLRERLPLPGHESGMFPRPAHLLLCSLHHILDPAFLYQHHYSHAL